MAGVAVVLGVALELSRDGAGRAFEPRGDLRERVLLVEQRGDGHALFGLELLIAFGWGVVHRRTLLDWQALHFTFESAQVERRHASVFYLVFQIRIGT